MSGQGSMFHILITLVSEVDFRSPANRYFHTPNVHRICVLDQPEGRQKSRIEGRSQARPGT